MPSASCNCPHSSDKQFNHFKCELPKNIQSLIDAWKFSAQSAAVVSTLFASVSAQLLGIIRSDEGLNGAGSGGKDFVLVASYAALVFNSGATISSLILSDQLGMIPLRTLRSGNPFQDTYTLTLSEGALQILKDAGGGRYLRYIVYHWILSLIVGVVCIFLQIMGFICLREGVAAKTIISVAVALALMPLVVLFLPSSNGNQDPEKS